MTEPVRPEVLISRLTSDNQSWRADAEARLVSLGEEAVDPLIGALRHANPSVRIHAVHALARLRSPRGIAPVIDALADTENRGAVAIAAEKALVDWGEPVKSALLQSVKTGSEAVRARALRALGKIGGEDLEPSLRAMLADPLPSIRGQAAAALGAAIGPRAVEIIAPLLEDSDKWVRYGVAEALVRIGSVRGRDVLEQARADVDEQGTYIRFWADDLLDEIDELHRTGRAIQ
ncbi:MAG TPA: HEAT repeat domain-containing protein [Myxococcaceae bacterium]|nr:HEAT repeat domain-containing protein [Myxococcaceae bacterium]